MITEIFKEKSVNNALTYSDECLNTLLGSKKKNRKLKNKNTNRIKTIKRI
jgi:hypothetical protein